MRSWRYISLAQAPSWFALCCVLLMAACADGAKDTLTNPNPASAEQSGSGQLASLESLSPFVDMANDTLFPPAQPTLSLSAQTGVLNFQWQPVEGQNRARLYSHDSQTGGETLVHESDNPTAGTWQSASQTQARAWHRQQYRIELCAIDDCTSSARMPLSGLAPYTIASLSPAVFIEGERYAEQLALNYNATVAVLTMPVEGAVEIQARIGEQWTLIQRLRLDALAISTTRTLQVALSHSGDTLAVFIEDSNHPTERTIRIIERLGETWLETAAWFVPEAITVDGPTNAVAQPASSEPRRTLALSSQGEQVLLHTDQTLMSFRQTESGWSALPYRLTENEVQELRVPGSAAQLMASAHNAEFSRVFTLVEENQQLYLSIWTPSGQSDYWQRRTSFPIDGVKSDAPLSMISDAAGTSVLVAGWEDTRSQNRTPVMWRYGIEPAPSQALEEPAFSVSVMDSLRAPPTDHANPLLIFTADASLTLAALGWHSAGDPMSTATVLPDAVLSTYRYNSATRQWLSALELPETLPTLAKQSFASETVLSADGRTMLMSGTAGNATSASNPAGEILVLR